MPSVDLTEDELILVRQRLVEGGLAVDLHLDAKLYAAYREAQVTAGNDECRNLALGYLRRERAHLAQAITTYDEHKVTSLREELRQAEKALEDRKKQLAGLDAIIAGAG